MSKYVVKVTLRTSTAHKIQSPHLNDDEAKRQLEVIRGSLGDNNSSPDIDWFAAKGADIIGAKIEQVIEDPLRG